MQNATSTTMDEASRRLGRLAPFDRQIVETLRRNEGVPITYDRLGAQMAIGVEKYKDVSSHLKGLMRREIVEIDGRLRTLMGRSASAYRMRAPYDRAPMSAQASMIALEDHVPSPRETIENLVRSIGTKGRDPMEVAIRIVDIMLGMEMRTDVTFLLAEDLVTIPAPYQRGSETSKAAAKATKFFRGRSRRRVYNGMMQCYRAKGRGVSRTEIWAATGVVGQTLNPRIVEMIKAGYVQVVGEAQSAQTGRMHELLAPTNLVPLLAGTPSSYYGDRLAMVETIQSIFSTPIVAAKYLAEPGRLFETVQLMVRDFIKKHGRPVCDLPAGIDETDDEDEEE